MFFFAFFAPAITPADCCSLVRHRAESWEQRSKTAPVSPQSTSATVTVLAFAGSLMHFRARLAVSPVCEASSKRQGDGQRFQKKAMKTTNSTNEASVPANVRPSSVSKRQVQSRPVHGSDLRATCGPRLPQQYNLAEVVGKWIWLDVSPARKPALAQMLWTLGFHWTHRRGVWQHPCGKFDPLGSHPTDPRAKYHSYYPADLFCRLNKSNMALTKWLINQRVETGHFNSDTIRLNHL